MDWLSVAVVLAVGVGAVCQVLTGVGFALVCSPLLILSMGHEQGIRTVLLMSIVLNAYVLARSFRHVRVGDAVALLIPASLIIAPTAALATTIRVPVLTVSAGG